MKTTRIASLMAGTGLLAIAASPALATTVDGITFPTGSGQHVFEGTISENTTTTIGEELTGNGTINTFDNQDAKAFCATPGCSLTYEFSGYTLEDITLPTDANNQRGSARFSGGEVNFYANGDMDNPWLTLTADLETDSQYTLEGALTNGGDNQAQNTAVGLLSVTGGSAAEFFDNDSYDNGSGGKSDLLFNTSLSPGGDMVFTGSTDGHYIRPGAPPPSSVPEPGALAMLGLGLGLVGFGVGFRRRQSSC